MDLLHRMQRHALRATLSLAACLLASVIARPVSAQLLPVLNNSAPGVWVEPDGTLKRREVDERSELAAMRARTKAAADAGKAQKLGFVSLPKAFAAAKLAIDAGKPIPDEVKYLGGLTRIDFLFAYPENNDLVICGPSEPVQVLDQTHAIGKKTARPVMRLEDFAVAMRIMQSVGNGAFGCRLDPDPAAPGRITEAMARMARSSRAERVKAVAVATGPQKVSFFGPLPDDSRFALVTLAADYELKRYGLGLARSTVPDLGNGVDNTRQAVNMWWYELAYDPILVSAEGNAYGLKGPRLKVQAGSFNWDPKGATPKAYEFAKKMSSNLETLATIQPLIADLQNLADLTIVAGLIQRDGLDRKANWDAGLVLRTSGSSAESFPVEKVTVAKTADALANYTNGSIAAGGVVLSPGKVLATPTQKDEQNALGKTRSQGLEMRQGKAEAAVVVQP